MLRKPLLKEAFLSLVSISFLFITAFWLAPDKEPFGTLKKRVTDPIRPFWLFWGLEQNWALFSPVIREINYHTIGVVTLKDGSKLIWEPPRMDKLDLLQRFRQEKFRKWGVDSLPWKPHKEFWPYIARYVGRQVYNKQNPPTQFTLLLYWTKIPPPTDTEFVSKSKLPEHTVCNHVFTYVYNDEDLR
jgi:hypothetical protein